MVCVVYSFIPALLLLLTYSLFSLRVPLKITPSRFPFITVPMPIKRQPRHIQDTGVAPVLDAERHPSTHGTAITGGSYGVNSSLYARNSVGNRSLGHLLPCFLLLHSPFLRPSRSPPALNETDVSHTDININSSRFPFITYASDEKIRLIPEMIKFNKCSTSGYGFAKSVDGGTYKS